MPVTITNIMSDWAMDRASSAVAIGKDSTGRIWVAYTWWPESIRYVRVRYSDDGGQTWSAQIDPTNGASDCQGPALAIDQQDRVHVFWFVYGTMTWQHSMYSGGSWSAAVSLFSGTRLGTMPQANVYAGASGKVHFVGETATTTYGNWRYARFDGTTLEEVAWIWNPATFNWAGNAAVIEDQSGDVHVFWTKSYEDCSIWRTSKISGVWQPAVNILTLSLDWESYIQALLTPDGRIHLSFSHSPDDVTWDPIVHYGFSDDNGATWTWEVVADESHPSTWYIAILHSGMWVDDEGVLNLAFAADTFGAEPDQRGVFYSRRVGGSWTPYETIHNPVCDDNAEEMTFCPTLSGPGLLMWRYYPTDWVTPELLFASITPGVPTRRSYAYVL